MKKILMAVSVFLFATVGYAGNGDVGSVGDPVALAMQAELCVVGAALDTAMNVEKKITGITPIGIPVNQMSEAAQAAAAVVSDSTTFVGRLVQSTCKEMK